MRLFTAWTLLAAPLFLGCGSPTPATDGGADLAAAAADLAVADLAAPRAGDAGCAPPMERQDGGLCLRTVRGKVVDEQGKPLAKILISVCGLQCFFAESLADGSFSADVDQVLVATDYAVNVHGRPDRTTYYYRLPPAAGSQIVLPRPLVLLPMPKGGPQVLEHKRAQTLTHGDVTVTVADGLEPRFDPEDVAEAPAGLQFRALTVADPKPLPFIDPASPPEALFALAPFEVQFIKNLDPVPVQIQVRSAAFKAGQAYDLYSLRGLIGTDPPGGVWDRIGTATADAQGRLTTAPGEGPKVLTWIAVRKKGQ